MHEKRMQTHHVIDARLSSPIDLGKLFTLWTASLNGIMEGNLAVKFNLPLVEVVKG